MKKKIELNAPLDKEYLKNSLKAIGIPTTFCLGLISIIKTDRIFAQKIEGIQDERGWYSVYLSDNDYNLLRLTYPDFFIDKHSCPKKPSPSQLFQELKLLKNL